MSPSTTGKEQLTEPYNEDSEQHGAIDHSLVRTLLEVAVLHIPASPANGLSLRKLRRQLATSLPIGSGNAYDSPRAVDNFEIRPKFEESQIQGGQRPTQRYIWPRLPVLLQLCIEIYFLLHSSSRAIRNGH